LLYEGESDKHTGANPEIGEKKEAESVMSALPFAIKIC
jgi:hypothetical protein